ncbi:MAG: hypothetical protein HZC28_13675 [Spirochaetes bacterium]|nr:hypothetical protein [Spirochaetota bacterium]
MENNTALESNLKSKSDLYVELGALLRKKRSTAAEKHVAGVIDSAIPIEEKIEKVKEIDLKYRFRSSLHLLRRTANDKDATAEETAFDIETHRLLAERGIYTPHTVKERRKRIKNAPERKSYLDFIFRDFAAVIGFAQESGVLDYSFFLPSIRPVRTIESLFIDHVQKPAFDLVAPLAFVEEHGWMTLTKLEYNLIAEFKRLVERIAAIGSEPNRSGESGFFVKLSRLENSLLICIHNTSYPEKIAAAVESVLRSGKSSFAPAAAADNIKRLLSLRTNAPTLSAMIVGLNIIERRRMLTVDALIDNDTRGMVNNFSYDCPVSVLNHIDAHIETMIGDIAALAAQRRAVDRIRTFLEFQNGVCDFKKLSGLLAAAGFRETMAAAAENMLPAAAHIAAAASAQLEPLLAGEITIDTGSRIRIFAPEYLSARCADIAHQAEKLERLARVNEHVHITRDRLAGMLATSFVSSGYSTGDIETMQAISRLADSVGDLAEELGDVHRALVKKSETAAPITAVDVKKGIASIPAASRTVTAPALFAGTSVEHALMTATVLIHLAAVFLLNQRYIAALAGEQKVKDELKRLESQVERLATPLQYDEIRDMAAL